MPVKFAYTFPLAAPLDTAWAQIQDPVAVARCLPGVESVQPDPDGRFSVVLATGFGPVRLRFQGKAQLQYDAAAHRLQADVTMSDARSGNVYGKFLLELQPVAPGSPASQMQLSADVAIGGKLGEFAQPLLKRKADQVVQEFAANVQRLMR